ncbi:MAG TPA: class I mannose-6-phosphate isomerase [Allosphingosinicella sp.]|jgi:mannose-6-phosphate isomerase|nr:class I mannose-6-phosphate isomerase [Allosphingosinicella sp.]
MNAARLRAVPVERVWGRRDIPTGFPRLADDVPVGEIWFEAPAGAGLLVKYLFTAERLSIQVHPDDAAAAARGFPRGKDEAWFVLDAEPGATIGLGLIRNVTREELRAAALDGSIEALLDWRPVARGDVFYSPAGTVHAIGGGIALIEIQQNLDLTYRLYDYGRPRELHIEEAASIAIPGPWVPPSPPRAATPGREILAQGGAFSLERLTAPAGVRGEAVVVPIAAGGFIDGEALEAGSAWSVAESAEIIGDAIDVLVARPA